MSRLDLFLPLLKVDVDQRTVYGVATAETPDRSGEICDYESTKPYFESWSDEARAASGGKSLGAVRAMHGRVAAGKLTDISFDDEGKRILVAAKIVDDDEWQKVTEGVYTGFSQGGRYVKRWPDAETGLTRYTAEPLEISLVDLPCLAEATFEIVKDGVTQTRAFHLPAKAAEPVAAAVEEAPAPRPDPAPIEALGKAASALAQAADRLEHAVEENPRLRKTLNEIGPILAEVEKRLAALESRPLPARAALRAVPRALDFGAEEAPDGVDAAIRRLADLAPNERALALTKLSLANPVSPRS